MNTIPPAESIGLFGVFGFLVVLIYIVIFGLTIYFMVSAIRFFKRKTQNDAALLQKLDCLLKIQSEKKES